MVRHYLTSALRSLAARPLNTAIKLLALALGLVCLLTAHLIGDYFGNADGKWAKSDRIYVIAQEFARPGGGWERTGSQTVSAPLIEFLQTEAPEIEGWARMMGFGIGLRRPGATPFANGLPVDPALMQMFDLEMVAGDASLDSPGAVVISETAATQIFGDGSAIGETVTTDAGIDFTVSGVFADLPEASHLGAAGQMTLHALISFSDGVRVFNTQYPQMQADYWETGGFQRTSLTAYVVLPEDGSLSLAELHRRMDAFVDRRAVDATLDVRFRAIPMTDLTEIRFNERIGLPQGVSITLALYLLGGVTLAVGCINFANLSAAEAALRAREIGLRKTVGARRRQVALQMLIESGLVAGGALLLILPVTGMVARVVTAQFGLEVSAPGLSRPDYWAGVAAIGVVAALAAGIYPALVLANLRPVFAMRARLLRGGSNFVRAVLIGGQFATAAVLVAFVLVMLLQQAELRQTALRPNGDVAVSVFLPPEPTADAQATRLETVREQLLSHPSVQAVTFRAQTPFSSPQGMASDFAPSLDPGAPRISGQARRIYYDYFSTMGVEVVAGRVFSRDQDETYSVMIDTATAEIMGMTPQEAVGEPILRVASTETTISAVQGQTQEFTIIGVVEREPLELTIEGPTNFLYVLTPVMGGMAIVRLSEDGVDAGLDHIRRTWEPFGSGQQQFNPVFLDMYFDQQYRAFSMITGVLVALAAVAVLIAAMGLFAMASFVVQRRKREVGVRKTLGASTGRVMRLLIWDFSKPVIAANLVAWPVIWLAAQAYLNLFVIPSGVGPLPFLAALLFTLLVAWAAVVSQAWRAARVKPAAVLKYE